MVFFGTLTAVSSFLSWLPQKKNIMRSIPLGEFKSRRWETFIVAAFSSSPTEEEEEGACAVALVGTGGQRWFTRSGDPISAFLSSSSSSFQRVFVTPCLGGPRQKEEETSIHIGTAEAKGREKGKNAIFGSKGSEDAFFSHRSWGKRFFGEEEFARIRSQPIVYGKTMGAHITLRRRGKLEKNETGTVFFLFLPLRCQFMCREGRRRKRRSWDRHRDPDQSAPPFSSRSRHRCRHLGRGISTGGLFFLIPLSSSSVFAQPQNTSQKRSNITITILPNTTSK